VLVDELTADSAPTLLRARTIWLGVFGSKLKVPIPGCKFSGHAGVTANTNSARLCRQELKLPGCRERKRATLCDLQHSRSLSA